MRRFLIPSVVGLALALTCGAALVSSRAEGDGVRGVYVEARTASVFAGACHYNGELTTAGREAVLAWNVKGGSWGGVDLAGVRAVADVEAMPDDLCCRMPQLVWYAPLVPVERRKVGYTRAASYAGGAAGEPWQRTGEN